MQVEIPSSGLKMKLNKTFGLETLPYVSISKHNYSLLTKFPDLSFNY